MIPPPIKRNRKGYALEVAVYQELLRRRAEVAYWKTRSGYEVDFYARFPDGSQQFIQVTVSIDDRETRERELRALLEAMEECHGTTGIVLTLESRVPWPEVPKTTEVMPAWQWMLLRQ